VWEIVGEECLLNKWSIYRPIPSGISFSFVDRFIPNSRISGLKSDFDLFDLRITHIQCVHFEGRELFSFDMVPEEKLPVVSWLSRGQAAWLDHRSVPGKSLCARVFRTLGIVPPKWIVHQYREL
jgi:hypothetical protein